MSSKRNWDREKTRKRELSHGVASVNSEGLLKSLTSPLKLLGKEYPEKSWPLSRSIESRTKAQAEKALHMKVFLPRKAPKKFNSNPKQGDTAAQKKSVPSIFKSLQSKIDPRFRETSLIETFRSSQTTKQSSSLLKKKQTLIDLSDRLRVAINEDDMDAVASLASDLYGISFATFVR